MEKKRSVGVRSYRVMLSIFFILLVLQTQGVDFAQSQGVSHSSEGHFSFVVPDDWEKISDEALDTLNNRIRQGLDKKTRRIFYDLAFQKRNNKPSTYPYMLLQIRKDGRISEEKLQSYIATAKTGKDMSGMEEAVEAFFGDATKHYKIGEQGYYSKNKIFFVRTESYTPNVGKIISLMAKTFSNYGSVVIHFYSTEDSFGNDLPFFSRIIDSFRFDEGYGY